MAYDLARDFPTSAKELLRKTQAFNIDAHPYNAKGDAVEGFTGVATNGDPTFTDTNAAWSAADIGKSFSIYRAAAAGGEVAEKIFTTTIASINSPTSIELTAAPTASRNPTYYIYGTLDDAAWDAVAAAASVAGGVIRMTPGKTYLLSSGCILAHSNITIEAYGAKIRCPALPFVQNVAQSAAEWLIRTTGKTHEGAADGANLKGNTTATVSVAKGDQKVRVASVANIAKGQMIWAESTQAFTSANARGKYFYAFVTHVDTVNSDVYFDRAAPMALTVSGQTVTVKTYTALENINILGGDWEAAGYAGDAANGGGQSLFMPQYVRGSIFAPERVAGFQGYVCYPMYSGDVKVRGGRLIGRPQDIPFSEGLTSGYYGLGVQSSVNCGIEQAESFRLRHHIDSYYADGAFARHNHIHFARTGALRAHNGSVNYDYSDNIFDACQFGVELDSGWGRADRNRGTCWGYGIYSLHDGTQQEIGDFHACNNDIDVVPAPDGVAGYPGPLCRVANRYANCRINSNKFKTGALGSTGGIIRMPMSDADHKFDYLELCDNTIISTGAVATDYPIEIGDTSKAFATRGLIKGNKVSAPSATSLIRIIGGSGGDPLANFEIVGNQSLDAASAASEIVDTTSGTFAATVRDYANNGPDFSLDNGGGFPAYSSFTPVARMGTTGGDFAINNDAGQLNIRHSASGKARKVRHQCSAAPTYTTDSGDIYFEFPGVEPEVAEWALPLYEFDGLTYPTGAGVTHWSAQLTADGTGNSKINYIGHGSGIPARTLGSVAHGTDTNKCQLTSGTHIDFRSTFTIIAL